MQCDVLNTENFDWDIFIRVGAKTHVTLVQRGEKIIMVTLPCMKLKGPEVQEKHEEN